MAKRKRKYSDNETNFMQILTKARNKNIISDDQRGMLLNTMKRHGLSKAQSHLFILIAPKQIKEQAQAET